MLSISIIVDKVAQCVIKSYFDEDSASAFIVD